MEDELHWGRAALKQFLWLLDEHQPGGVVVVDCVGVRLYRFWMGEVEEQKAERFALNTSQWRKKSPVRPARLTHRQTGRSERGRFRTASFLCSMRESIERRRSESKSWAQREKSDSVFIAGPDQAVESVKHLDGTIIAGTQFTLEFSVPIVSDSLP